MMDKEEMIEWGGDRVISKAAYQNALKEYYKTHKTDGVVPLTYDGKVIGRVYTPDGDIERLTMEITTDEGRKIIYGIMNQPIGISARKIGSILEDGTVDDSHLFTEFSFLKKTTDNYNVMHSDYQQKLFYEIVDMKHRMQGLARFVQNDFDRMMKDGATTKDVITESIKEMNKSFDEVINELNVLREKCIAIMSYHCE